MPAEYLPVLFALIALLYSAVGFGGGSSYLALLSLFLTEFYEIRSTALILNISVVTVGTLGHIRHRVFDWRRFWPFLLFSIPCAYLGARIQLSQKEFFLVLGSALWLSGLVMGIQYVFRSLVSRELPGPMKFLLGGGVGLLSGVSGIGGGIFLSPALHLVQWANPRIVAALASVFILANSLAGLTGLALSGTLMVRKETLVPLLVAVVAGGTVGSYLSHRRIRLRFIGLLTALLVTYVGLRLILWHGFGLHI